jgi:hypothetical protein
MSEPPRARPEQHQSKSDQATQQAKSGQPLPPDDRGQRSPKQENL